MKNFFLFLIVSLALLSCNNEKEKTIATSTASDTALHAASASKQPLPVSHKIAWKYAEARVMFEHYKDLVKANSNLMIQTMTICKQGLSDLSEESSDILFMPGADAKDSIIMIVKVYDAANNINNYYPLTDYCNGKIGLCPEPRDCPTGFKKDPIRDR